MKGINWETLQKSVIYQMKVNYTSFKYTPYKSCLYNQFIECRMVIYKQGIEDNGLLIVMNYVF